MWTTFDQNERVSVFWGRKYLSVMLRFLLSMSMQISSRYSWFFERQPNLCSYLPATIIICQQQLSPSTCTVLGSNSNFYPLNRVVHCEQLFTTLLLLSPFFSCLIRAYFLSPLWLKGKLFQAGSSNYYSMLSIIQLFN